MIDGLKQEQQLVGSTYSDFVSGTNLEFGTATITTITPTTVDATTLNATTGSFVTANITTLNAVTMKAGSHALSSGSRWVIFTTPFASASYSPMVSFQSNARIADQSRDGDWVAVSGASTNYGGAGSSFLV